MSSTRAEADAQRGWTMPEIVRCPACGLKVQMAESVLGTTVRCGSCGERFVAVVDAPPPPPAWPLPPPEPPARRAEERPPPRDDWRDRFPGPPEASGPRPRGGPRPLCPGCARPVDWDARRCPACGEEFLPEFAARGRRARLGPRRDCEDHRGPLLLALGKLSLVLGGLALCFGVTGALAVPLGLVTCLLARQDLDRMERGAVDPAGRDTTETARNHAVAGALLGGLFGLAYGVYFVASR